MSSLRPIPLVPIFVLWDGVVSVLRSYKPDELEAMAKATQNADSFEWEAGVRVDKMIRIVYLSGNPK